MPRLPMDFSRTIIYKLVCKDLTIKELYVGATTNWSNRQHNHKSKCNNENSNEYNLKVYQFIRNNGGFDNWSMIMVEKYPCKDKLESDAREHYFTELLGAKLNIRVQGRTKKEHYEANKDGILEYQKIYRENNKEELTEYHKKKYEKNKEELTEKAKLYYEANKDKIGERQKLYNEANIVIITEKRKAKITCGCGSIICKSDKSIHNKTKKHINYLSTL